MTSPMRTTTDELLPDHSRTIARLFLPNEDMRAGHSRVAEVVHRVLAIPPEEIEKAAERIVACCMGRIDHLMAVLEDHAATMSFHIDFPDTLTRAQTIVLGAAFTSEYAVEGAALCNPSAVPHPDQSGLPAGALRVAVSMRGIGEGHISSIGFASAVISARGKWTMDTRDRPLVTADITDARWRREHFKHALEQEHRLSELTHSVIRALPEYAGGAELELAIRALPVELAHHHNAPRDLEILRNMMASAYEARFPPESSLSQRVLVPISPEEASGMEDARFVLFTYPDGSTGYRGTYTAYAGHRIAPRLITSPDLAHFEIHRLSGEAAHNKGIALFPRHVGERYLALTRTDGESMYVAQSEDGTQWTDATPLHSPRQLWEIIQTGNCGSPIETDRGWLVVTHGVGPMRHYSIGALLLDLEDPTTVIGYLKDPLLEPEGDLRNGYVPNVVYSCGGVVHNGVLWLPYGVGDSRIRVASAPVTEILDLMVPLPRGTGGHG